MFLTRSIRSFRRDESGSALVAVVGVMAVGLILTAMVMTSVVSGYGFTTSTRAGVQSQAAADAGIAIARAGMESGTCGTNGGVFRSAPGAIPSYQVTVWRQRTAGGAWEAGCPTNDSTPVRLVSTGIADALGVAGVSGNDESRVEAVLAQPTRSTIGPSGPAVYAYWSDGFSGSGRLNPVNGSVPSVLVKRGNVSCSGASDGGADWVIDGGNLDVTGSCGISGNVWSTGRTTVSGAVTIGGNVVGSGVTLTGSGKIGGSVWSDADVTLSGAAQVWGNMTGVRLTMSGSSRVVRDAWVYGSADLRDWPSTVSGNLTAKSKSGSGRAGGRTTVISSGPGASPFVTPVRPVVPEWTDFPYNRADWPGFTEVVIGAGCNESALQAAINGIGTAPGIVDARGCSQISIGAANTITTRSDLVILANKFALGGSGGFATGSDRRLWLITPDTVDDNEPTCQSGMGPVTMGGAFSFSQRLSVMVYTPCRIAVESAVSLRGQLYGGKVTVNGAATVGYVPLGLPNVDLSTGVISDPGAAGASWRQISVRNLGTSG